MRDLNIAGRDVKVDNSKKEDEKNKLLWLILGTIGTIIATAIGAWIIKILNLHD